MIFATVSEHHPLIRIPLMIDVHAVVQNIEDNLQYNINDFATTRATHHQIRLVITQDNGWCH